MGRRDGLAPHRGVPAVASQAAWSFVGSPLAAATVAGGPRPLCSFTRRAPDPEPVQKFRLVAAERFQYLYHPCQRGSEAPAYALVEPAALPHRWRALSPFAFALTPGTKLYMAAVPSAVFRAGWPCLLALALLFEPVARMHAQDTCAESRAAARRFPTPARHWSPAPGLTRPRHPATAALPVSRQAERLAARKPRPSTRRSIT